MTSYAFKRDVAVGVATLAAPLCKVAFLLIIGPFVAIYFMAKGLIWFVADPRGRWCVAMAWWCLRHPRQSLAWGWAHLRYQLAVVRRAVTR